MRVIYYLQNNIRAIHILAITFLTLTSCGTYQQASYDDDGIYGSGQERRQTTEVATTTNGNSAYQNYFEQKSLEADDRYGDIFTDVDSYSSEENLDSETNTEAIGYSESYSPWGDTTDDIIINVYSSPIGYGGWGFNRWGYGFNRWGFNNFGYNWGFGFGGAYWCPYPPYPSFWSPGFYNPYYGYAGFYGYGHPYFNRYRYGSPYIAYNRGRRANYYRNPDLAGRNANTSYSRRGNNYSRRYNASRSSRRANNVRATRSNTRTIRSTQNTRTRNNTRVTRNTRQVRSTTRSNTRSNSRSTRSNSFRTNRSTRSSSFRSSGGGRSSSGGTRSSGGRGRGGRG